MTERPVAPCVLQDWLAAARESRGTVGTRRTRETLEENGSAHREGQGEGRRRSRGRRLARGEEDVGVLGRADRYWGEEEAGGTPAFPGRTFVLGRADRYCGGEEAGGTPAFPGRTFTDREFIAADAGGGGVRPPLATGSKDGTGFCCVTRQSYRRVAGTSTPKNSRK